MNYSPEYSRSQKRPWLRGETPEGYTRVPSVAAQPQPEVCPVDSESDCYDDDSAESEHSGSEDDEDSVRGSSRNRTFRKRMQKRVLSCMSLYVEDIEQSMSTDIPSKLDNFVARRKPPKEMSLKFAADMRERGEVAQQILRSEAKKKVSLFRRTQGNPAPEKSGQPTLTQFSTPGRFHPAKPSWPLELPFRELPFQPFSDPAPSDLEAVSRTLGTATAQKVKDVSLSTASFKSLEESLTYSIQGLSVLTSLVQTAIPFLGTTVQEGEEAFPLKPPEEIDTVTLAGLLAGVHDCTGTLASLALHQRTQLAGLYRDAFLAPSGFTTEERAHLRSLPLSRESLIHEPWLKVILDKKHKKTNEKVLIRVAEQSTRSGAKTKQGPQPSHSGKKHKKRRLSGHSASQAQNAHTQPTGSGQQQRRPGFTGPPNRGRGGGSGRGGRGAKAPNPARQNPSF